MRRREFIAALGSAAVGPAVAQGQQPTMPVIGYLSGARESAIKALTARFLEGLSEKGYVEDRNIRILYRWAETQYDRLPSLAADLIRNRVNLIVTTAGSAPARAARDATATIPIVFQMGEDPVEVGVVASLNRPGGNITGATFLSGPLTGKRLELLHQMVPSSRQIGLLINPTNAMQTEAQIRQSEAAGGALGLRLIKLGAGTSAEIEAAFAALAEYADRGSLRGQ